MRNLLKLIIVLILSSCSFSTHIKISVSGYAKTSVNAVIFRNAITSNDKYQCAAFYDSAEFVNIAVRKLNSDFFYVKKINLHGNAKDAHNSISIFIDKEDCLHLCYNQHNNPLNYYTSKCDSLNFLKKNMIGNENNVTYPQFYSYKDGILFFYRSAGNTLVINKYDYVNHLWSRLQDNILQNAYWQSCIKNDTIYLSWCWCDNSDVSSNNDVCFAKSADGRIWYKSNNDQHKLPITKESAECLVKIPKNSGLINQTSMAVDSKNNVYIATYFNSDYYLIYYDTIWKIKQIIKNKKFSLTGIGTKSVPISRPLILISEKDELYFIYRDSGNLFIAKKNKKFETKITIDSVGYYEPVYDKELWLYDNKLHLFIQCVGQGDNETLDTLNAQKVEILEINL